MRSIKKTLAQCLSTFVLLQATAHAEILINEVDADTQGTDKAEFIELSSLGSAQFSLDDYSLVLFNGSNDSSYLTVDLTGKKTNKEGFFVICGNAEKVANCDLDISPDENLVQNGADAVALYRAPSKNFPKGTPVTTDNLVDAVAYDTSDKDDAALLVLLNDAQPQINENALGNASEVSNQRCDQHAKNTTSYMQATPTPGMSNTCPVSVELKQCGDPATLISAIQGEVLDIADDKSPLLNAEVVIEGIVTMDLQGGQLANGDATAQYNSYFLQEESADSDDNPETSEAIMVFDKSFAVNVGDKVRVKGMVNEKNKVTQLSKVTASLICSTNNPLPAATPIALPVASTTDFERVEGMRIINEQNLIVSDLFVVLYGLGNDGQFAVSSELLFNPTEIATPGSEAYQQALNARKLNYLIIDDGVSAAYPSFIPFPDESGFSASNPLRIGYKVPGFTGVMHAKNGNYMLIPSDISLIPDNIRTEKPFVADNANLIITAFNVLNYFNGDGLGGGFPTARGAPTLDAFNMQEAKIVAALDAINADVIALMEIESDGYSENSAIDALVKALNKTQKNEGAYRFIRPSDGKKLGTDAITVGLLYRHNKIILKGKTVTLDSSNSPSDESGVLFDDKKNRPSLIQTFSFNGFDFTVSVNHLKSKGSACREANEAQDGQGNCNINRTRAAKGLAQFLSTQPTGINANATLILGDINAYSKEDPAVVFENNGYTNLKYTDKSDEKKPYSYSFGGFVGSLDHAFGKGFLGNLESVTAWHINSVEDSLMGYMTEANGQTYQSIDNYANADAYRSSDHDPIVLGFHIPKQDESKPDIELVEKGSIGTYLLIILCSLALFRIR